MICISCQKSEAVKTKLDSFHCQSCLDKQKGYLKPGQQPEFTTQEIRDARVEYDPDLIQPYREGKVSRKFIEKHGTARIQATKKEIKEAMNKPDVWSSDTQYYNE